ncbi:hypothetical protein [Persicitalea jodogahamensis]|uniref:Uncharacterized protein n=1 Tax=Persicitalea jodogahamensis TaxID=402147 RepID=A0A8J3D0B2_9BACT|nr:hypothetical protein [Persicitalea jodogahamensis]GHB56491.1 hypothetical protein GCM10007390_07290 [Persicitalea jodogahamensis]
MEDDQLQTLHEIRSIMDRSTRFQSLSGLSGIFVGLCAMAGAGAVQWYLTVHQLEYPELYQESLAPETIWFVVLAATAVFCLAAATVLYFTTLKARKSRQSVWTLQSKRLLLNFCLPMAVGGAFCSVLLFHNIGYLVAPGMLVFYGLALINASKFAFADLRSLGVFELALGLVSGFKIEYGLLAWTLGFGLLHVFYGSVIYYKYEKYND